MLLDDIQHAANTNDNFRQVLYTGTYAQVVLMSVVDEIGMEVHPKTDQLVFITSGMGEAIVDGEPEPIQEGDIIFVRAGSSHNFVNRGDQPLKLYTIYAPPAHPDKIVEKTRNDALLKEK